MSPSIDAIATHAAHRPAALAVHDLESGRRWSYAALDRDVDRVARWLIAELGPASGERVAAIARNSAWLLILHLACVRAGAIHVPLNWRLAQAEIAQLIDDARPALLFHDSVFAQHGGDVRSMDLLALERVGLELGEGPAPTARRGADEASTILYTSGTSGRPKGVVVTEANAYWGCANFIAGNDVTVRSVFLADMPMFHTAGLFAAVRVPLQAGAAVLISQGFDPERTLARIADPALGVTHYFSVPQMAQRLWQQPGFDPAMLRGLTVYAMGGAPNPAAQIERFVRAGVRMSDGFGMSETGSSFGMPSTDPHLLIAKAGSCGLPYLSLRARIVDEHGRDVGVGERGELWLSGPSVTPGYWNQPALTAAAFSDGWFRTGDIALRDADGFFFLVDRKKDMFISGGENVYPAEVEAVLAEIETIAEAAVIGVADPKWGEVGHAYVIPAPGVELSERAVLDHCRARMAGFKVPARIFLVDAIPRTSSGKVQKHILRLSTAQ
ncbi:AMP-binding protein [Sphingobium chlorophenolicum]|uniref:O-succinylbenzoate--CoA ligase n=2 Tax=Sphingobium chlorophenolicum TaxID=46429 RepID=A0A081REG6_SPHCR|nr:AMP-binding protein [Sphingobium chlorophenolicum]KEQ53589.1 O-succinylbenzoate--CoA ligase [Sphingobium chlorophenolicum]